MNKNRFFYHWRKSDDRMTVHFRKRCINVYGVTCLAACEEKRNKRQPRLVMQGFAKSVTVVNDRAIIT
jgi:hypothetical protein